MVSYYRFSGFLAVCGLAFYGLTTLTSELLGPGRIEASYAGRGETYLWAHDGKRDAALEAVCAARGWPASVSRSASSRATTSGRA